MLDEIMREIQRKRNPEKAKLLQRFFKTGKGEYGEGDIFLGITVPEQRKIAKKYTEIPLKELQKLLSSRIHEYRLIGLLILIQKNKKQPKKEYYDFYLKNTHNINNWDLVDLSAPNILGNYLKDKDRKTLYKLVKSKELWKKRIAILATFSFIKDNDFEDAIKICELLLQDEHDLIHKATGWALREIGKKHKQTLIKFLDQYTKQMPRTMLRYAIERLPEKQRLYYLKK